MNLGAPIAIGFWTMLLLIIAVGLSYDIARWWKAEDGLPEAIRWWFDQRRELRHLQHAEVGRAQIFDQLESEWAMPCAPDPKRRTA